jgi:hypothetical protein
MIRFDGSYIDRDIHQHYHGWCHVWGVDVDREDVPNDGWLRCVEYNGRYYTQIVKNGVWQLKEKSKPDWYGEYDWVESE